MFSKHEANSQPNGPSRTVACLRLQIGLKSSLVVIPQPIAAAMLGENPAEPVGAGVRQGQHHVLVAW